MLKNRSIPQTTVIPELAYPDVGKAIAWLSEAFGFRLRLRIADHRAQMHVGDGAMVIAEQRPDEGRRGDRAHSVLVRVEDVNAHHQRAQRNGARIVRPPTDHPFGERQYTAEDFAGHCWTFSQSIADVDPRDWGGTPGEL